MQPLPPSSVPPSARYPLYADAPPPAPPGPPTAPPRSSPPGPPPAGQSRAGQPAADRPARRRTALPWVAALALLALVALTGIVLLVTGGSPQEPQAAGGDPTPAPVSEPAGAGEEEEPSDQPAGQRRLAALALVDVPATAPASTDGDGNRVSFHARRMLDGDPRTAWRMAGDGTGQVVTFRFDEPVEITSVGLVNGYAKKDPPHDWYDGNRRILRVSWLFEDGSEVTQDLRERRALQVVDIDPVSTRQVQLRILDVTAPGRGRSGRDYTAISEVAFGGPTG
ncbi:discoidin domain-containing protein [Nocardioides sp. TF02-7]|uniref:discoidin domain-containing protein n=1 Tax=Nocardioides sp. TF02-7 TaxID=2917724 RepID=UPI001F05E799|nr:discoidin domain-containing protein [Nocardioides sp. TF02-7]UMG92083.1 discoidin domain-containing protein [Nocardioides sp. TF02-7]